MSLRDARHHHFSTPSISKWGGETGSLGRPIVLMGRAKMVQKTNRARDTILNLSVRVPAEDC